MHGNKVARAVQGAALRDPADIMRPEAMSAFKASRLSFARGLVRKIVAERWRIERWRFDLDAEGRGEVIYRIETGERPLYFVIFSNKLPEAAKTERIIGNHYDGEGFLCEGTPDAARIAFQKAQLGDFLTGRADMQTIGWSRVNRSARSFDAVVGALAAGRQPDAGLIAEAGYVIRNNGYWGNGRHGTAVFPALGPRHPMAGPYYAEMFVLFLWRHFACDLVEHIARCRNAAAARLHPAIRRFLGIGNSSGIGMIPFVVRHPRWIHNWCWARESALADIKEQPAAGDQASRRLVELLNRALAFYGGGLQIADGVFTGSYRLVADLSLLSAEAERVCESGAVGGQPAERPWLALCDWAAARLNREVCELLHSCLLEAHPELTDAYGGYNLIYDEGVDLMPERPIADVRAQLAADYAWALSVDRQGTEAPYQFWYLSEENLEPRLGQRGEEPGEAFETFVDVVGRAQSLAAGLSEAEQDAPIGLFLLRHPEQRFMVERLQSLRGRPYGEVRGNLVGRSFLPCHLIRFTLALYGMEHFDPRSTRWVRGTFLQGAPTAADVAAGREHDWIFPAKPDLSETWPEEETDDPADNHHEP